MTPLPQRTRNLASLLYGATLIFMLLVLGAAFYLSTQTPTFLGERFQALAIENTGWEVGTLAILLLLTIFWLLTLTKLWGLWNAAELLKEYRSDRALSPKAAQSIRNMGLAGLCLAILQVLRSPIDSLALTLDAPAGQHMVSINLGTGEIGTAIAGGTLLLIGFVMSQAVAISQENQEFV